MTRLFPLLALLVALSACTSRAASPTHAHTSTAGCDETERWDDGRVRLCEERVVTLAPRDLRLDATTNGGVRVAAWDRDEIEIRATVSAVAPSDAEAERLLQQVRLRTDGTVRAETPEIRPGHDAWVAVEYDVRVPRRTDLDLTALNGGIQVEGVSGDVEAQTVNGALGLDGVDGRVRARTVNGSVAVNVARWSGDGMDVSTTNGSITMDLPPSLSATVDARTSVGPIRIDGLPLSDEGCTSRGGASVGCVGGRVRGDLGSGGPTLRASTTHGAIRLRRR